MHTLEVFNHTAHKVVNAAVSYAHIQANNAYYKDVLGLEMNKKMGSSAIYLTQEQYSQVKISKSFYIQYLILVVT
jgi:catechol-2,3-dioxygenase